jgi:hypothetical protein
VLQGSKQYPFDKSAEYYEIHSDYHATGSCSEARFLNDRPSSIAILNPGEHMNWKYRLLSKIYNSCK